MEFGFRFAVCLSCVLGDLSHLPLCLDGEFDYVAKDDYKTVLQKDDWIAEAVLWVPWMHRGPLTAGKDHSTLCALDAKLFQEI